MIDMKFDKGRELARKLHNLIPGGGHTYSKGDDQFPQMSPGLMVRGKGAYAWDADGNRFLDYGMGLRSVGLGYAHDEINQAVIKQMELGTNLTKPATIELELAQKLVDLIPCLEMVKFAKNGSDTTSAAIRLARAYTGKKYVAICKDHPFYSFNDWFIASTPCANGIPQEVKDLTLTFHYNDIESVEALFEKHPNEIAAFILEPMKTEEPRDDFLKKLRKITQKHGTLLIFDEMISGFRFHLQGAGSMTGVTPDLTTFGKGCANGYSVAFLGGRRDVMELGGIYHDKPRVFLLSGTHGSEATGLAAAIKNIEIYERDCVIDHHWNYGKRFKDGINDIAKDLGIDKSFAITGFDCSPNISCRNAAEEPDLRYHTLFSQEMIKGGVLMPWIAFSYSHQEKELEITLEAASKALEVYKKALEGDVSEFLVGEAIKPVWRKFNK